MTWCLQMCRSSRSVCANLAEAWRKRRYEKAFMSKLSDAESEAAETQVWIEFAVRFGYLHSDVGNTLIDQYAGVLRTIVGMITHPGTWVKDRPDTIREEQAEYGEDAE